MASVFAGLSSYPMARATDGSTGSARGTSFWIQPLRCSRVVSGQGEESCQKIIRRLLGDHFLP